MKVLVAMSGGVDSSVAAALMVEEGHEVIGATLKLWQGPNGEAPTAGCCTVSDSEDARRVAAQLDIPYYVLDYTEEFMGGVVEHFVDDYVSGRTPNPCIECNRTVKFSRLLEQAEQFGCDKVVTGHYARVEAAADGYELLRGLDAAKDQSYVLYMLGQQELERVAFPVGGQPKSQTRAIAERLHLRTAHKPDSQDICFVGDRDYRSFLDERVGTARVPGNIVDEVGEVVGTHDGVVDFTVGQRRGVGVAVGERRYVTRIEPTSATVTIGPKPDLAVTACIVPQMSWVNRPPDRRDSLTVKIRYRSEPSAATVDRTAGGWEIRFARPEFAVSPGQAAVVYEGDRVLGGGTIASTTNETANTAAD